MQAQNIGAYKFIHTQTLLNETKATPFHYCIPGTWQFRHGTTKVKSHQCARYELIDVVSGTVLTNQIILISNDTIVNVGPNLTIPPDAEVIDLSHSTVLPGLIDCHTHITGQPSGDYYGDIFRKTEIDVAITAHIYAKRTLEAGFTTCRDVGAPAFVDVALRNAINNGDVEGPRLQVATLFIGPTGGHGDLNGFSPYLDWKMPEHMSGVADGVEGVREQVRHIKYGADVIKFGASAGVLSGRREQVASRNTTGGNVNANGMKQIAGS